MIDSIVLGLVEGVTEFLPVSSTGHLLVAEHFLSTQKSEAYNVLIQVGPILASALVLHKRIFGWFKGWRNPEIRTEILQVLVAFLITGFGGLVLDKAGLKLPDSVLPIAIATLVGVPVILLVERFARGKSNDAKVGWGLAVAVAGAQLLAAAFPGTSRSGACVMAALLVGASRSSAVEFSFLVGIPTMFAAGGYKLFKEIQSGAAADLVSFDTLLAFTVATISAFVVVKWLLGYVRNHTFVPFAWYRLALGVALLAALFSGLIPNSKPEPIRPSATTAVAQR
jgi:undecaprenyl-diphosphatase